MHTAHKARSYSRHCRGWHSIHGDNFCAVDRPPTSPPPPTCGFVKGTRENDPASEVPWILSKLFPFSASRWKMSPFCGYLIKFPETKTHMCMDVHSLWMSISRSCGTHVCIPFYYGPVTKTFVIPLKIITLTGLTAFWNTPFFKILSQDLILT